MSVTRYCQWFETGQHGESQSCRPVRSIIARQLLSRLDATAAEANGIALVAECAGSFLGFVAGWVEQTDNIAETPDSNRFRYISDICIPPAFRGKGIAVQTGIGQYLVTVQAARLIDA